MPVQVRFHQSKKGSDLDNSVCTFCLYYLHAKYQDVSLKCSAVKGKESVVVHFTTLLYLNVLISLNV